MDNLKTSIPIILSAEDENEKLSQKYEKFLKALYNYEGELQVRKYLKEKEQLQKQFEEQKAKRQRMAAISLRMNHGIKMPSSVLQAQLLQNS